MKHNNIAVERITPTRFTNIEEKLDFLLMKLMK